jgi:hypothetical protein
LAPRKLHCQPYLFASFVTSAFRPCAFPPHLEA